MNPAFSVILFTTLAGAAQGLVVVLGALVLAGAGLDAGFASRSLWLAVGLLVAGLVASFFHLGRPERAWRAALMWRTSWMSREVIVLPAFIVFVACWAFALQGRTAAPVAGGWMAWAAILGAAALWYCTAMIYACLRFIQEWAHPITVVNYTFIGLASGCVLAGALAVLGGQPGLAAGLGPWTIAITLVAWAARGIALRRNAGLKPKSTIHSATGISGAKVVQKSMGFTGGSFNTREFFHHASLATVRRMKLVFQVLCFALPATLVALAMVSGWNLAWLIAVPLQLAGVLAERWFFFAQARHPQNLYYQVVS